MNGDSSEICEVLCKSDIVRKLSFTGTSEVGMKLYKQCSQNLEIVVRLVFVQIEFMHEAESMWD